MHVLTRVALMTSLAAFHLPSDARQAVVGGDPWQFVHPRAKWILGVDWARARNSAAARILSRQFAGARGKVESSGLGLSAVVSLERIVASGVSLQAGGNESPAGLVVAIEGKLDRTRLRKELPPGTAVEKFRGADLYVPPRAGDKEPLVAVVQDSLMLIGDRESLGMILAGKGGARDPGLYGRAARLASETELWMVASPPQDAQAGSPAHNDPLRDLRSIELAVSLRDGLRIQASLEATTIGAAQNLAGMLQLAGAMGGGNAASAWLRRMQAEWKDNVLNLSLAVPAEDLERGIESGKEAVRQAGRRTLESWLAGDLGNPGGGLPPRVRAKATPPVAPVDVPGPPSPPRVRTIRITGAESGPSEIHYVTPPGTGQ